MIPFDDNNQFVSCIILKVIIESNKKMFALDFIFTFISVMNTIRYPPFDYKSNNHSIQEIS